MSKKNNEEEKTIISNVSDHSNLDNIIELYNGCDNSIRNCIEGITINGQSYASDLYDLDHIEYVSINFTDENLETAKSLVTTGMATVDDVLSTINKQIEEIDRLMELHKQQDDERIREIERVKEIQRRKEIELEKLREKEKY